MEDNKMYKAVKALKNRGILKWEISPIEAWPVTCHLQVQFAKRIGRPQKTSSQRKRLMSPSNPVK